ncbi:response regulator transcription factor [Paraliomyxa miuraensis]|uniref:response regulator transcription factor n=1 Tax=Paraliomyxa miuraensis TaxID=376150 RepID=UPI00225708D3|nr:LuxR C-terminal-related transcriptional regulator [Paraliomyxa miuraensis]MCX4242240.1 LuxR C-terminal-related transcriptional regulator [Paraliomyxa miuraensis]
MATSQLRGMHANTSKHSGDDTQPCVFLVADPMGPSTTAQLLRRAGLSVHLYDSPQALLPALSPEVHGCVVLDVELSWAHRRQLQQALLEREIVLPIIFMTDDANVLDAVATVRQGAVDILPRPSEPAHVVATAVRAIDEHAKLASHHRAVALARARWHTLSSREQQVCRLVAQGLLNKQIAAELGTRESTVQAQRSRALHKLDVASAVEVYRLMVLANLDE